MWRFYLFISIIVSPGSFIFFTHGKSVVTTMLMKKSPKTYLEKEVVQPLWETAWQHSE